jgi:hypothetical protein
MNGPDKELLRQIHALQIVQNISIDYLVRQSIKNSFGSTVVYDDIVRLLEEAGQVGQILLEKSMETGDQEGLMNAFALKERAEVQARLFQDTFNEEEMSKINSEISSEISFLKDHANAQITRHMIVWLLAKIANSEMNGGTVIDEFRNYIISYKEKLDSVIKNLTPDATTRNAAYTIFQISTLSSFEEELNSVISIS